MDGSGRQQLLHQICPFDQADAFTIKIILIADLIHLFDIGNPVNIKMIERQSAFLINLQYRKGRAADRLYDAQSLRKAIREYGLSDAQIALQRKDLTWNRFFSEIAPE